MSQWNWFAISLCGGIATGINATKLLAITCAFPLLFVVAAMAISCFKLLGSYYYEKYASPQEKDQLK